MELSPKNLSVVLIDYRRPKELAVIIEQLRNLGFEDIIIWDNTVINKGVYGRYLACREAKHDLIYTQDDDCLIYNIDQLIQSFDGTHLSNNLKREALDSYSKRNHTLVGWGAIFDKQWVNFVKYVDKYGEDQILYTNADRIFTASLTKPYNTIIGNIEDLPSATDGMAMSLQPNYLEDTKEAMRRLDEIR